MEAPDTKGLGWLILAIAIFCAVAGWGLIELAETSYRTFDGSSDPTSPQSRSPGVGT